MYGRSLGDLVARHNSAVQPTSPPRLRRSGSAVEIER